MAKDKLITVEKIMAWGPRRNYTEDVVRKLFGRRNAVTAIDVLRSKIPQADRLWVVLREELLGLRQLRLFACKCADRSLKCETKAGREPDARSVAAVVMARRFAMGKATVEELSAAESAAWSAARSA